MKHTNYEHLTKQLRDWEYEVGVENYEGFNLQNIIDDIRDEAFLQMLVDIFNDSTILADLPTAVLKDMLAYYIKHSKGFEPAAFDYNK